MLTGSCLCRAIRYEVNIPITELRQCHCTDCQKVSGAGGTVNALIASSAFRITHGEPRRFTKVADSGRTLHRFFCADCGSPIYSQREVTPEMMTLRAGTLDNAPPMKVVAHIWTASARSWAHIDPATQRFPGQPDAPAVKK
ncbi:MAG TPA: GFA family protein [Burkholderiales bacterium]|nr:GFA family protein [Burkholderiales bacterium]